MPTPRTGFIDSYHASRLNHLKGTAYPAAPVGSYLALYIGSLPVSDGTGGSEATGTRPSIALSAPQTDANNRQYVSNTSAITATLTNTAAGEIVGFGLCGAATGGTPIYMDRTAPFQVQPGASVTIPAGTIRIYAEPPTY